MKAGRKAGLLLPLVDLWRRTIKPMRWASAARRPAYPRGMLKKTFALGVLFAMLAGACGVLEPSAADLVRGASAKMQSAKSVHVEGTGSFGMKAGLSMSFDFKLAGDLELPDRSRMKMQMSLFGQDLSVETLTVDGKAYAKDPLSGAWTESSSSGKSTQVPPSLITDPLGSFDLSKVANVVEVDRPVVNGQKTRHFQYTADNAKLADAMRQAAGSSQLPKVTPTATGEVWIGVDDGRVVRQTATASLELDSAPSLFGSLGGASASPATTKASFQFTMDFTFSNYGQPIPAITAPPVAPRSAPTLAPSRSATPQPTH